MAAGKQKAHHQEGLATPMQVSPHNVNHALNDGLFVVYDFHHTYRRNDRVRCPNNDI